MKNFTTLLLALLLFGTTISCKKDDDTSNSSGEYFTAKFGDNESFTANQDTNEVQFIRARTQGINSQFSLALEGRVDRGNRDFYTIGLSVNNYNGVGTYTSGTNSGTTMTLTLITTSYASNQAASTIGGFVPGELIITKDDGEIIEGTFKFDGYNFLDTKISVWDGRFKANFDIAVHQ